MNQRIIHNMALTVINDGNGDQCGLNYAQRCALAEHGWPEYVNACHLVDPSATVDECGYAGEIVREYYRRHVAETRLAEGVNKP